MKFEQMPTTKSVDLNGPNRFNIAVITHPFNNIVGDVILANFIGVLEPLSSKIYVITGNFHVRSNKKINIRRIKGDDKRQLILIRGFKFILTQLRISYNLIKIYEKVDIVIFHIGARIYTIPMLFAKLLRMKTVVASTGSSSKSAKKIHDKILFGFGGIVFWGISGFLEHVNFHLADQIAVESEGVIEFSNLQKYRKKISITGAVYIDTDNFKIKKKLKDKRNLIGYIGRLSPEKGVLNFAKAISLISKERDDLDFLIGGDGSLFDEIKNELENNESYDKVKLTGWIPDEEFSTYLNELKLFVLPSYTEGLPHTLLEAMACGTPVLATPVGAIPDVIKDGETGFIMENNSPECIAENIVRALAHPNINEITKNARALIEENYNYKAAVDGFKIILSTF